MKIQTIARYGAIAAALALAGLIGAIGVLTLIFAPRTGAYAPVTSSDAAAWIQAVGSIAAIAAAYWLGERQARKARDQALEVYHLQRRRIEAGARGIVGQLYGEIQSINHAAKMVHFSQFRKDWNTHLRSGAEAALVAFDNMPILELGTSARVRSAFQVRTVLEHVLGQIDEIANRAFSIASSLSEQEQVEARMSESNERSKRIQRLTQSALDRQKVLRDDFYRSYVE